MTTALTTHTKTPMSVDRQLRSLASSLDVNLSGGKRLKPKYDKKGVFLGNEIEPTFVTANGDPKDLAAVAKAITETLEPPSRQDVEIWLAELSVIAPARVDDAMTATLKLEAYGKRLAEYPADMVRHALLGKTWRFFPSWFELEADLKAMRQERDKMLAACLGTVPNTPRPPDEPARISAERAAEIMAEAGFKPKTFGGGE